MKAKLAPPTTGKAYWAWFIHEAGPYHITCYSNNSGPILKAYAKDPKFIGVTHPDTVLPTAVIKSIQSLTNPS